jgi:hypothetical protein
MSSHAEIAQVHKAETKMKLKPHLVKPDVQISRIPQGPLSVTLEELLTPETLATLRKMGLVC